MAIARSLFGRQFHLSLRIKYSSKAFEKSPTFTLCGRIPRSTRLFFPSTIFRRSIHSSTLLLDHYSVLGVPKSASAKDIKLAYFKSAKIYHPDALKGSNSSPQELEFAKKKWQELANAYETLSDVSKRKAYDESLNSNNGFWGQNNQSQSQSQHQQQQQQANPNQTWSTVTSDADVIEEAIREYAEELKEDAELVAEGISQGDLGEAWRFVKHHKGLVASIVVPTFLIFRFPAPVMAAMRFLPQAILAVLAFTMRVGGTRGLTGLWGLVGHAAALGSKGAAARAQAYTVSRKSAASKAERAARQRAQRTGSTHHDPKYHDGNTHHKHTNKGGNADNKQGKPRGSGRRSKHF